jgi:hypothetical protein
MGTGTDEREKDGWTAVPVPGWDTVPKEIINLPWHSPSWWRRLTARRWPGLVMAFVLGAAIAVAATLATVNLSKYNHYTLKNESDITMYVRPCGDHACKSLKGAWVRLEPGQQIAAVAKVHHSATYGVSAFDLSDLGDHGCLAFGGADLTSVIQIVPVNEYSACSRVGVP